MLAEIFIRDVEKISRMRAISHQHRVRRFGRFRVFLLFCPNAYCGVLFFTGTPPGGVMGAADGWVA